MKSNKINDFGVIVDADMKEVSDNIYDKIDCELSHIVDQLSPAELMLLQRQVSMSVINIFSSEILKMQILRKKELEK